MEGLLWLFSGEAIESGSDGDAPETVIYLFYPVCTDPLKKTDVGSKMMRHSVEETQDDCVDLHHHVSLFCARLRLCPLTDPLTQNGISTKQLKQFEPPLYNTHTNAPRPFTFLPSKSEAPSERVKVDPKARAPPFKDIKQS